MGPARAFRLISKHGSIEKALAAEAIIPDKEDREAYLDQVELARLVFKTLPPVPAKEMLVPTAADKEAVNRLLRKFRLMELAKDPDAMNLRGNYFGDNPEFEANFIDQRAFAHSYQLQIAL